VACARAAPPLSVKTISAAPMILLEVRFMGSLLGQWKCGRCPRAG
jgi:hypothetical protein